MKYKELQQRPEQELKKILTDSKEKLRQLRFELASGKVKDVREIRQLRRDIAKILTLLGELSRKNK